MASDELKSCPFCGGKNVEPRHDDGIFWHKCKACGATGPTLSRYSGEEGEPYNEWNTRTQLEAIRAAGGELSDAVVGFQDPDSGFLNKHEHRGHTEPVVLLADAQRIVAAMAAELGELRQSNLSLMATQEAQGKADTHWYDQAMAARAELEAARKQEPYAIECGQQAEVKP